MRVEIKVPGVGESVTEATLAEWFKKDGDRVQKDEPLFVIETDKVTLEVVAEADGVLSIDVPAGETVAIGAVVGTIDTEKAAATKMEPKEKEPEEEKAAAEETRPEEEKEPPPKEVVEKEKKREKEAPPEEFVESEKAAKKAEDKPPLSPQLLAPSVRDLISKKNVDANKIEGTGPDGRITRGDVLLYIESTDETTAKEKSGEDRKADIPEKTVEEAAEESREEKNQTSRKPMTQIRRRIAARLLKAKQNTAMLTTFNEIDMRHVQDIRTRFKESFKERYDVSLGLMSFFIKATTEALKEYPEVNAFIDNEEIVYHHYYHIGIAVGGEKGLVVPVIRHADQRSFAELEQAIVDYVHKIRDNRLELADLEGGTFTITNGGVYGSLLSTPILNTPQSGILGMHKIEKRPVVVDDKIEIRPMMYVALSYDHRIIDGRQAVTFLKRIKECIENPERMMMEI
jgi:2-oxoglutarate dehydrogenase E2 component (dihydrolipoamide succinyltransferase)